MNKAKRKAIELSPTQPEFSKIIKISEDQVDNRKVGDMIVDDFKKVIVDATNDENLFRASPAVNHGHREAVEG